MNTQSDLFVYDSHSDDSDSDPWSSVPEVKIPAVQVSYCVVVECMQLIQWQGPDHLRSMCRHQWPDCMAKGHCQ